MCACVNYIVLCARVKEEGAVSEYPMSISR